MKEAENGKKEKMKEEEAEIRIAIHKVIAFSQTLSLGFSKSIGFGGFEMGRFKYLNYRKPLGSQASFSAWCGVVCGKDYI